MPDADGARPMARDCRRAGARTSAMIAAAALVLAARSAAALTIGTLHLVPCRTVHAWCGSLERHLDPTGGLPDRIDIHFELYRHTAPGPAAGTLVATEGGPGYPATESRTDYLALFAPLRATRDVLIMDNRGTGRSGALDCHALQTAPRWTIAGVGDCGRALGPRAPLYSTALAADDLAALLDALELGAIDLYGDSYGTYFEQVFAVRHPAHVHSLVLDGAYPLDGPDYAWYPSYAPAMRAKFDLACARAPACARRPGSGIDHIEPVLAELRRAPYTVQARDADAQPREFRADAAQLAILMFAGAPALASVRELDAAASAFLAADRRPLERLMAETLRDVDSRDPTANPRRWSAGLAAAVLCEDPPQIVDLALTLPERMQAHARALAERERDVPDTYAPFTIDEYRAMPLDYSFLDLCLDWPTPPPAHPAARVIEPGAAYPDVPALVISGELDDITTVADGAAVARAFRRGRQIVIANSFHVNALPRARSGCGALLARRFFASGEVGDTACAGAVPPVRLVTRFATHAEELEPLAPLPGNEAGPRERAAAAAALLTVGDVLLRAHDGSSHGEGLRGGAFEVRSRAQGLRIRLHRVRWTDEIAVSGWIQAGEPRQGVVRAQLRLEAGDAGGVHPSSPAGLLTLRWREGAEPRARVEGVLGDRRLRAEGTAP